MCEVYDTWHSNNVVSVAIVSVLVFMYVGIPATHLSFRIHLSVYNMALKANSEVSRLTIYLFNFK